MLQKNLWTILSVMIQNGFYRAQLLRQPAKDAVTNKDTSAEDLKQRLLSQQEVLSTWKTIMEEKGNEVHEQ